MTTTRAERKWMHRMRAKQEQEQQSQQRSSQPLPNESDFARYYWVGQNASDEFFKLHDQPDFGGLGPDSVVLPANQWSVSRSPTAGISVIEAYPNGLSYAEQVLGAGGVMLFGLVFFAPLGTMLYSDEFLSMDLLGWLLFLFSTALLWFMFRFDTTGYRHQPVLFDRAAGKVHVFFDHTKFFSLWPLFGGGKCEVQSFDWSCLRAQVRRTRTFTGHVAQENASLSCIVFAAPDSGEVVAQFQLGIMTNALAVQSLLDHWEHIRRFMEHQGPLFVQGEGPYVPPATHSLLGAICFGQPFIGPGAKEQWQTRDVPTIVWQLIAPLFFPLTMLFGLLRWVSLHIRTQPKWPADVLASVGGAPLQGDELAVACRARPEKRPT